MKFTLESCDHVGHLHDVLFSSLQLLIQLDKMLSYVTIAKSHSQFGSDGSGEFTLHEKCNFFPKVKKPFQDCMPAQQLNFCMLWDIFMPISPFPAKALGTSDDSSYTPVFSPRIGSVLSVVSPSRFSQDNLLLLMDFSTASNTSFPVVIPCMAITSMSSSVTEESAFTPVIKMDRCSVSVLPVLSPTTKEKAR